MPLKSERQGGLASAGPYFGVELLETIEKEEQGSAIVI